MQPRKWKGAQVHCLTMFLLGEKQILRALADSREEAEKILGTQICEAFTGAHMALNIVQFNADQAAKSKDERDRMAAWMLQFHPQDFARILGIAEAAVEEYRAKEVELQRDFAGALGQQRGGF